VSHFTRKATVQFGPNDTGQEFVYCYFKMAE